MKTDLILAGVGGQGILSIAAALGTAALRNNLYMKQSEVHGMSQRGGAVESHMRISDKPIASDLIPQGGADVILSVEPMESLRYLPFLKKDGWVVTNSAPFVNITNYPNLDDILATVEKIGNHIIIDADAIAKEIKSPKSSNIVMLGAASPFIEITFEKLEEGVREIFSAKGQELVDINLLALRKGREFAQGKK